MLSHQVVRIRAALIALPLALTAGCVSSDRLYTHQAGTPEAISAQGAPLYPMPLDAETEARYTAALQEAESAYRRTPHDELTLIWLGRW